MMLGRKWRGFSLAREPHLKWTLIAAFNVMHHFLYQASQSLRNQEKAFSCLYWLKHFFTVLCPGLTSGNKELYYMLKSQATTSKSDDVFHSLLAFSLLEM